MKSPNFDQKFPTHVSKINYRNLPHFHKGQTMKRYFGNETDKARLLSVLVMFLVPYKDFSLKLFVSPNQWTNPERVAMKQNEKLF